MRLFLEEGKAVVWAHVGCVGKWRQNANSKQQDLIENHTQKVLLEGSEGKKKELWFIWTLFIFNFRLASHLLWRANGFHKETSTGSVVCIQFISGV